MKYITTLIHLFFSIILKSVSEICLALNPLNAELNAICYLLALLGAHPILHVSRIRVKVTLLKVQFCIFVLIFDISPWKAETLEVRVIQDSTLVHSKLLVTNQCTN